MSRTLLFRSPAFLVLLVFPVAAGCGGDSGQAGKGKEAPKVTVVHPEFRPLTDEAEYNGWLQAYKSVDVRSRIKGHIVDVKYKDGDLVKADETELFDIDDAPLKAELAQVDAQTKALEAQQVAAQKVFERNQELIKTSAVSRQELEKSEADTKSFAAQIEASKADAARILLDLKYCKILAPVTGRAGKANLIRGDYVNAGGTDPVLTTVVAEDPIFVDFNVDERAVQRYQQARAAQKDRQKSDQDGDIDFTFGLDTEKGFPHRGKLIYRDIKFAEGTGTILVRGLAENKDGALIPGSRVRVRLPVSEKYSATRVPDEAICTDQKQKYVLVVDEKKNAKRINVEMGRLLDDGMRVILAPPLKPDDLVICEGMERARLNYPVEPIEESPAAVVSTAQ